METKAGWNFVQVQNASTGEMSHKVITRCRDCLSPQMFPMKAGSTVADAEHYARRCTFDVDDQGRVQCLDCARKTVTG